MRLSHLPHPITDTARTTLDTPVRKTVGTIRADRTLMNIDEHSSGRAERADRDLPAAVRTRCAGGPEGHRPARS
jgi:hypothetical protein